MIPQLTAAIDRFRAGDRTPQTLNLVAAARVYDDQREQQQADDAESKRAQSHERRDAATLPAPSAEVAALLSGTSDLLETPLPHDVELLERSESVRRYSTSAATVMELTAAYQHRMTADGWTYDWRCSGVDADLALMQQKWYHTNSVFLRPAKPVQCVSIIVESRDEAISIQLQQLSTKRCPIPHLICTNLGKDRTERAAQNDVDLSNAGRNRSKALCVKGQCLSDRGRVGRCRCRRRFGSG